MWTVAHRDLRSDRDRLDIVLAAVAAALLAWTAGFIAYPQIHVGSTLPAFDLVLDTVGLLTTLAVGVLGWIRYRETDDGQALLQASAFIVFATPNAVHVLVLGGAGPLGADMSLVAQGQAPVYAFAVARLIGALLLMAAAFVDPALWPAPARRAVLVVPAAFVATTVVIASADPPVLPDLGVAREVLTAGVAPAEPTGFGIALALGAFGLLLVAALVSRDKFRRSREIDQAFVTVGLVIGAFVEIDFAFHPAFAGLVTVGDLLRIAFYLVLLAGLVARSHVVFRTLSASNVTLARLKDSEAERAALEERARLSRELHDGLAQSLWYVKLKATRLATLEGLPPEARRVTDDLTHGVEAAIGDARQAVMTLRSPGCPDEAVSDLLARTVDDFQDRYGVHAEFTCSSTLEGLPTRTQAELLRICQEALANVARHADASVVRVGLSASTSEISLSIRDNGRGFDPGRIDEGHFGLAVMRERAALIGGSLDIESEESGGTTVAVRVPAGPLSQAAKAEPWLSGNFG